MAGSGFTHILVAIDGSSQATEACRVAVALAHCYEAALTAIHVAVPIQPADQWRPASYLRAEDEARARGTAVLDAARALASGRVPLSAELEFGDPAAVICRRASELDAELVVVGSRGLGAIDRLVLGSVSSAVTRRAPCSVLVVRRREAAASSPLEPRSE